MSYLVAQMLLCLLLATVFGFFLGWVLKRCSCTEVDAEWRNRYEILEDERNRLQLQLEASRRKDFAYGDGQNDSSGAG